jgi:FkbM family methyltransferase
MVSILAANSPYRKFVMIGAALSLLLLIYIMVGRDSSSSMLLTNYRPAKEIYISNALRILTDVLEPKHLVQKLLDHEDDALIIDIGAHHGTFGIPILKRGHRVIMVEPDPRNFKILKENINADPIISQKATLHHAAISTKGSGTIRFYFHKERSDWNAAGLIFDIEDANVVDVPSMRVDQLAKEDVFLLKTDTQGFETNVMKSAQGLLSRYNVRYIIAELDMKLLESSGSSVIQMVQEIDSYGYRCFDLKWELTDYDNTKRPGRLDLFAKSIKIGQFTDLFCMK